MANGRLKTVIEIDHKAFDQGLAHINQSLDNAKKKTQGFGDSLDKSSKGLGKSLAGLAAKYVTLGAGVALLTKTLKSSFQIIADFERKNSELASVLGTTKEGIKNLSDSAEELGRKTEFTSTEVTELQIALARLGFTESQITAMQGTVLKFAASVNTDLGRAANFAGAALRGFGLQARDSAHLLDVMAAATTKSALDFSKLETSMSIVAPIAHSFGLSVEDTVTLLGSLANAGFDASSAATATRNILLNLADSNGKLAKGLGHTARTFPEIIAALKECTARGIDLNSALEMTDKRSVSAFSALISGAASAEELRDALGDVDGTLDDMYDTMTDNLVGAVRQLKSAWEGLVLTLKGSTGPVKDIIKQFARGINVLTFLAQGKSMSEAKALVDADQIIESGQFKTLEEYDAFIEKTENSDLKKWTKKRLLNALKTARGKVLTSQMDASMESLFAEMDITTGGSGGDNGGNLTDEEKKAIERFDKAYKKAVKELWKSVTDTEIQARKEGAAKKLAQIDNEEQQALAAIDEEFKTLKEAAQKSGNVISQDILDQFEQRRTDTMTIAANNRKEVFDQQLQNQWDYLSKYGTIKEQELAITQKYDKAIEKESDEYKRKSLERQKADELAQLNESRLAYLEQYGTYKEKEAAITEKYNSQIARSNDEVQKMILGKERDKALRELEQQYNSKYHLIFADAESLSDNLLAQAIDATQEAIKKAKDSGDIQALTELYERLRKQMNVQGDKQRGWGWNGISEGFALRSAANGKRTAADTLEQLLKNSEEAHEVLKEMGVSPEDIEASREEIEQLRADIQRLRDDAANDDANALSFLQKGFTEVGQALSELGSMMSSFRDNMGGLGDTIADIGEGLSAIGSKSETIQKAFSGSMGKGEAWSTIISGTIELIGMVGQSIAENKRIQEEWNRTIEQAEHKYRMLKLEAMDYKQQNIFGVENPYKKAIDGAMQYRAAMEALNEQINKLAAGQVQTGTKKVTNWKNVGKGSATGAAVGAAVGTYVVPAIGTAIGTAIGAIGGAIAGLFSKKRVAVFDSLKNVYGELFDPNTYELNPKLLADYEKLDADTKQIVDNWEEIRKKAQEAEQQMRDTFKNLSGDIGNQLSDSLINAFRNGELYSAIDDFHDKMTSTIEDIMEQMVFSSTMGAMFDELEERMVKSFDTGGDEDIVDDLIWMENEYQKRLYQYESAMSDVKESLRSLGYDAWKPDEDELERSGATKTGITATQDSVDESNARMTTIQGHTYELNENVRDMKASQQLLVSNTASILEHVQGIHKDTTILAEKTDDIQKDVSGLRSDVGKIITNGVTVKR